MRIDFANTIDVWHDFGVVEACARKCATPLIRSQKARVGADFGICLDIGKTFQNLKHQLGVDRLIDIGAQAFADYQPAIACQSKARLIQAKQKILGDMQDVDCIYEIELARSDALNIPRQIEVERAPLQCQLRILPCEFTLTAPPEECVRFCDHVAF